MLEGDVAQVQIACAREVLSIVKVKCNIEEILVHGH